MRVLIVLLVTSILGFLACDHADKFGENLNSSKDLTATAVVFELNTIVDEYTNKMDNFDRLKDRAMNTINLVDKVNSAMSQAEIECANGYRLHRNNVMRLLEEVARHARNANGEPTSEMLNRIDGYITRIINELKMWLSYCR